MNKNQNYDLKEQASNSSDATTTKPYYSALTKFLIVIYALIIAFTVSMHIHTLAGIVITVVVFVGYMVAERALYLFVNRRKPSDAWSYQPIISLYFICISLLYCLELRYDIVSACDAWELMADVANLFFALLYFIMVGAEYYSNRSKANTTIIDKAKDGIER